MKNKKPEYAFWPQEQFPYIYGGKVAEFDEVRNLAKRYSPYGNHPPLRPVKTTKEKEGIEFQTKLNTLVNERAIAERNLKNEFYRKLLTLGRKYGLKIAE